MNNHAADVVVNKYRRHGRRKGPRIIHEFMMMFLSCVMMIRSSIVMGFAPSRHGSFQNNSRIRGQRDYLYTVHTSINSGNNILTLHISLSDDGDDKDDKFRKYNGSRRRTPNRQGKKVLKGKGFQLTKTERDQQRAQSKREGDAGGNSSSLSATPRRKPSSASNQRVKMKKMTSSSTLLPPPSILSSSSRTTNTVNNDDDSVSAPGDRWVKINSSQRNKRQRGGRRRATTSSSSSQRLPNKNTSPQSSSRSGDNNDMSTSTSARSSNPFSSRIEKKIQSTGGRRNEKQKKDVDYLPPPPPPSSKVTGKQKRSMDLPEWGEMFNSTSSYNDVSLLADLKFPSSPAIDGVLPVSELFYRSTQSISGDEDMYEESSAEDSSITTASDSSSDNNNSRQEQDSGDDEELPFSAEQSDRLSTPGNKIQIRRNNANVYLDGVPSGISDAVRRELTNMAAQEIEEQRRLEQRTQENLTNGSVGNKNIATDLSTTNGNDNSPIGKETKPRTRKNKSENKGGRGAGRKMVRRGMEMLVGGEPINADPPQRSLELNYYRKHPRLWSRSITTNSPDFGPLMHMHSAGNVSRESVGLYCENFVDIMQKWNICPDDLKIVVSEHEVRRRNIEAAAEHAAAVDAREQRELPSVSDEDIDTLMASLSDSKTADISGLEVDVDEGTIKDGSGRIVKFNPRELNAPKGFGATQSTPKQSTPKQSKKRIVRDSRGGGSDIVSDKSLSPVHTLGSGRSEDDDKLTPDDKVEDNKIMFTLGGELKFSLGVSRTELESGHGGHGHGSAFRRVLREGIGASISAKEMGFDVNISKLVMVDVEGGSTDVMVQFQLDPRDAMDIGEAERAAKEVNGALASAMNDGKMAMSLARVAREEKGWTAKIRDRIVEEFLFETEDDEDKGFGEDAGQDDDLSEFDEYDEEEEYDGPFGMEGDIIYSKDDIWLGGGNGGVFFDYSETNEKNSPYQGKLGPYLVDAAVDRARQNQPKVIAIGDVHGCIDELEALLRKCDYHPGDLVVFLGDLVCKGPDSLSVVQMAREIGAIGVRGNHDFEVVRWHQAIKSGADAPVIGSEHYYVASALSTADLKWMYSLPWFISSSHLNALFVHAGFVSGIRLAKQNPRLMMNMRSILPDGTVTSKFFNNWPWARLWDGPQTVFFGHDADRGLQQYEHAIGLDTGCVYGGKLTACILPERRLVSVNAKREYFQYRRKHFD